MRKQTIFVYAAWDGPETRLIGRLFADESRGREIFSFEYDESWLKSRESALLFDPDLMLFRGRQYAPADKDIFGIFADSCPDRWGRTLMNRRETIRAREEGRSPRKLLESDYLLGVYDETRMGGLRFSVEEGGEFLSGDATLAAPPWTKLRTLETAALEFEKGEEKGEVKWIRQLVAPGSSLGGARPKASVSAPDGSLWIAKFPSRHDEWNSGAWEMVLHDLAAMCEINVPEAKLENFSALGSTFLIKRFDRKEGRRIHYLSAMTALGKKDGDDETGYPDIVDFIRAHGASPEEDLRELFARLIFNMTVTNTDDHLRNHGFLLGEHGWRLSPAFDLNPAIYGDRLSLLIDGEDNLIRADLALKTAGLYGLDESEAKEITERIEDTVCQNWRSIAERYGIPRNEMNQMEPAFKDLK